MNDIKSKLKKNLPFIIFLLLVFGPTLIKVFKGVFFVVFVVAVFFIAKHYIGKSNINKNKDHEDFIDLSKIKNMNNVKSTVGISLVVIIGLWLFFASIYIVEAGETGVYSLFGKVKETELRSGFHLVIPVAKITRMTIRTQEYTMSIAQGEGKKYSDDSITTLTKEGLEVSLDMTVLYHLEEDNADVIYREVGLDYEEKIIRPEIRTVIREIVAQYEAKDLYSEKREEASIKIFDNLVNTLSKRGVIVEDVMLRNVALPANLAKSIQEKLQAEQEAQKYDFILDKEKKEKERKKIEAEGQRDAQKIINESLSTNYLYYLYVNQLKEREGTIYVPTSPGTGMPLFRNLGN